MPRRVGRPRVKKAKKGYFFKTFEYIDGDGYLVRYRRQVKRAKKKR